MVVITKGDVCMKFKDLTEIIEFIEHNLDKEMSLDDISEFSYYSLPHIHRSLKSIMEYTLKEYIRKRRLSEAASDLVNSERTIIEIAFKYQYNSNEAFTRAFKQLFKVTPKEYRSIRKVIGITKKYRIKGGRNLKLLNKIDSIYQKYYENPSGFNLELELSKYTDEVLNEVNDSNYSKESINFAVKILFKIGKYNLIKKIFEEYLKRVDNLEDEDWVRYNLMMIRYNLNDNLFEGFNEYYEWMKKHIEKEKWYFAVCNSSVFLEFFTAGKGKNFLEFVDEIRKEAPSTVDNRQARFETTRALVLSHFKFKDYNKVKDELSVFNKISLEDKKDMNYLFNRNEYITRRIYYLNAMNEDYSKEVEELMAHIDLWKASITELIKVFNEGFNQEYYFRSYDELRYDRNPLKSLRSVIHNSGCMFYFLGEHQKALDMFDDEINNGYLNSYSAGLYMGSVYETTNNKDILIEAIAKQKRILENTPDYWKKVKELDGLQSDVEFLNKLSNLS